MDYLIVMFCLSAGLLIYALIIRFGGYGFIPRNYASEPKDKKEYAKNFSKILALIAIAPAVSGLVGIASIPVGVIVLIAGFIGLLIIGLKIFWRNE